MSSALGKRGAPDDVQAEDPNKRMRVWGIQEADAWGAQAQAYDPNSWSGVMYDPTTGQYTMPQIQADQLQYVYDPTSGQYMAMATPTAVAANYSAAYGAAYGAAVSQGYTQPGYGVVVPTQGGAIDKNRKPPGDGYVCKWCKMQGGQPESHWHQSCPMKPDGPSPNEGGGARPTEGRLQGSKPGSGYRCKWCHKPGGMPDSHWHNGCPSNPNGQIGGAPSADMPRMNQPPADGRGRGLPGAGYRCRWCQKEGGLPDSHWHQSCPFQGGGAAADVQQQYVQTRPDGPVVMPDNFYHPGLRTMVANQDEDLAAITLTPGAYSAQVAPPPPAPEPAPEALPTYEALPSIPQ